MHEDGGGGDSNSNSNSNSNRNSRNSGGDSSSSGNGGSDFDDVCESWSEDGISNTGANSYSSSCSADEGCYSGDGDKSSTTRSGNSSSDGSGSDGGSGGNKRKWLISWRTVLDRVVGSERKGRSKKRVVKTILRPPTTYKYVIGMSGLPSKVAVYPKSTMM